MNMQSNTDKKNTHALQRFSTYPNLGGKSDCKNGFVTSLMHGVAKLLPAT